MAQLLKISHQEVIEALYNSLNGLQVESALFVVVLSAGSLNCQIDILKHWEEHLTENLSPEFKAKDFNSLL